MANTIQLKRRVSGNAGSPAALKSGEVAHNEVDNTLYVGKGDDGSGNATSIVPLAGKGAFADLTSPQTIAGAKTFTLPPKSAQDASGATDLVRKSQMDASLAAKADASHSHAVSDVTGLQSALDAKAPLTSPALSGTPTAPTATSGTNTTQIATTAFVQSAVSSSAVDALGDIGDVLLTTPGDNALLAFDSTSGNWINQTPAEAGVAAANHAHSAADITSGTLPVVRGGTGATSASGARAALGVAIGTDVQAYSTVLAATTASFTTADATKLGHISVTQAVDLDAIETRVNALDAAVVLKGTWNAGAGSFPGGGTAQAGESWIVSSGGTVNGVAFAANDRVIAITDNASTTTFAGQWHKADYSDEVQSVAGKTGAVTLVASDITSGTFANARIAQSNVTQHQAALSISNSQVLGLGTMATQAANNVAITGGTIAGVSLDGGTF